MSQIIIEDTGWRAIMEDPRLANARRRLSFHEIRLIVQHARDSGRLPKGEAGTAECEASQSGGEAASPNPSEKSA